MSDQEDIVRVVPVYVVIPPRVLLLDVAGPLEVLRKANLEQHKVRFDVRYVGPASTALSSIGLSVAGVEPLPEALPHDALVIVSGAADIPLGNVEFDRNADTVLEKEIVLWLRRAVRPGVRLVTICSGALLAARAGLLDGYSCTTHHLTLGELERLAPAARVYENRLFVEDGERLTSAGITAGIDLMLHVVAGLTDHATALAVARYLVVYLRRSGNDPQLSPWLEGRNHMNPVVHRAQDAIAHDPAADWSVERLADIGGASPRNFSRLFNEYAGMTVTDYVNRLKISLAREMLLNSELDIENVAAQAGFASARQFRRVWQRIYKEPPSRIRIAV
ncbi:GlxA family transcriptional regulator [Brucella anthropi]|uniref:Transcriptional regulator, AraC family n=1 Tax=Brucella anthropi (strain ATCC 49188 / DSM 6882 / CCUG 24695 / JCM 21032 / LMG 3331 / NBRC 15819 / NCTC 12168 / Alc 37) TaxID=439375 RepID=A6X277_BRUA4|nr:helix-turn-helix domain-containing protein [Brucella anthropi]ABS15331.1 transcriptional regulator, AraC family [Brucella anthropi ATCC 49188]KAB2759740.1 helix-turn-helix domain-containing protein [Brucella anthropi]KAB2777170.1 helix-turn-helix domain-containing protein [Brucella anthropi]QQC24228.1 helix-turn-helix domain-containing protein [Brucella anthropi]RRY18125.1 helix-turn-helix domain-containing protein [Brucella anthropi]